MSDLDPDRITETRTSIDPTRPTTEVTRTVERSSGAAWWAVALVGIALIFAVTYVITRSPTNTDASVAAATQQIQSQAATQQAQGAAAQAQSAADSAAQSSQSAAARSASTPPPAQAPSGGQGAPAQSDDQGGGPPQ